MPRRLVMRGAPAIPVIWESLFAKALSILGEISRHGRDDPFWTFGGGTALMLRYAHRVSKDIDIFVPDPQSLGFVTPRLSDVAEAVTSDYLEAADYVKLYLPEGEIDFVASPNLTAPGFEWMTLLGHEVRVETPVEIIAKKLWHRADRLTGRDIFDFAVVAQHELSTLMAERQHMVRHALAIFAQLEQRNQVLNKQFNAIDAIGVHRSFNQACELLKDTLRAMLTD